ncbi:MAG TPA: HAD family hydrolase [Thermococcus sp.]|nr:HAD family hydrolase [Thermococcus sp.]
MSEKRVISFDLEGTLVDSSEFNHYHRYHQLPLLYSEKFGVSLDEAMRAVFSAYEEVDESSLMGERTHYWLRRFGIYRSPKEVLREIKNKIKIYPEVPSCLERLKKHFQLIISSGALREFLEVELEVLGGNYFTHTFSSVSDFGILGKPAKFYIMVCDFLNIKPENLVHIGDSKKWDFVVPRNLGINSYLLDREGQEKGTYVVRDLREFSERLLADKLIVAKD